MRWTYLIFFVLFHPILFLEYRRAQRITGCLHAEDLALVLRERVGSMAKSGPWFQNAEPLQIARDLYILRHNNPDQKESV